MWLVATSFNHMALGYQVDTIYTDFKAYIHTYGLHKGSKKDPPTSHEPIEECVVPPVCGTFPRALTQPSDVTQRCLDFSTFICLFHRIFAFVLLNC